MMRRSLPLHLALPVAVLLLSSAAIPPHDLAVAASPAKVRGEKSHASALPRAVLRMRGPDGGWKTLQLEVADTAAARARGLMFRKRLAEDEGMLLLWKKPQQVAIWMKNTYVPLDIVFIGADWRVVRIHENARPLDITPIPSFVPVLAVLEVRAGMARRLGLVPGQLLRPEWVPY